MIPSGATIALNPLQWFTTDDGWLDWTQGPSWPELMRQVKEVGFDAVHTRIPPEHTAAEYARIIRDAGLEPAPGTFAFALAEDGGPSAEEMVEKFRATARGYAEIGLQHLFVIPDVNPSAPRVERPAIGADADPERRERIRLLLTDIGRAVTGEGVLPILHPHVGTWVETAAETRYLLDGIDAELMGFGPDVGHLTWAGEDPVALIREYADRVHGVHVKDLRLDVRDASKTAGLSYRDTIGAGLWIEPGRGDMDYEGLWDALGPDFTGTVVVEVDKGDITPAIESAKVSARWAAAQRGA